MVPHKTQDALDVRVATFPQPRDHVEEPEACLRYAVSCPPSNLSYFLPEAKEPAFLQKLRGQYGSSSGRLERPSARPRKAKDNKDDDDDEPVYIDEESNEIISKEEYRALTGVSTGEKEGEATLKGQSTTEGEDKTHTKKEFTTAKQNNLTEVGGQRKRKQAKVVGEEKAEGEQTRTGNDPNEAQTKAPASRKPKKAKKIKLSFDDE